MVVITNVSEQLGSTTVTSSTIQGIVHTSPMLSAPRNEVKPAPPPPPPIHMKCLPPVANLRLLDFKSCKRSNYMLMISSETPILTGRLIPSESLILSPTQTERRDTLALLLVMHRNWSLLDTPVLILSCHTHL